MHLCYLPALPFGLRAVSGRWDRGYPQPPLPIPPTGAWRCTGQPDLHPRLMLQQVPGQVSVGMRSSRMAFWEPVGSPREIPREGGEAGGEGRAEGRAGEAARGQPWGRQWERGSENAFGDKNKPDAHRRNRPITSLRERLVRCLPSPLGATEQSVPPPRCTGDAGEIRRGGGWSKPVGTRRFQSHFCHCIKICLYLGSLLNISSFLLVYICTSSGQSTLHQALIYRYSL